MMLAILKGLMKIIVGEIKKIAVAAVIFLVVGSITLSVTDGMNAVAQLFILIGEYIGISKIVDVVGDKK